MTVSAVVVAYRTGPALTRCLESLAGEADEVVVVDNGDGGPEIEDARGREGVRVVSRGENLGFAGGCNFGASEAADDTLVFLGADTYYLEHWSIWLDISILLKTIPAVLASRGAY